MENFSKKLRQAFKATLGLQREKEHSFMRKKCKSCSFFQNEDKCPRRFKRPLDQACQSYQPKNK